MNRMRRVVLWSTVPLLLLFALFALGTLWPLPEAVAVRTMTPVVIVGATIVDVEHGSAIPRQTIVIDSGRISGLGYDGSVGIPGNALRIDGSGRYLMPALFDMHTHVYAVSPLLDMPLYIAYGVTNVRDMQGCPREGDPFIACAEDKRRWTLEARQGRRVGPRILESTSFMANGPRMRERIKGVPRFFGTETPDEARAFVRHQAATGIDAIKVYDRLPREAYFALVDEALRLDLDVVGHRPLGVSLIEAAAAGQKSIEHARSLLHEAWPGSSALRAAAENGVWHEDRRRMVDQHDAVLAQAIFDSLVARGTWYVPTHLTRWVDAYAEDARVREDSLLRYLHPLMKWQWMEDVDATIASDPSRAGRQAYRDFYTKGLELTGSAHRAGVKILTGTDYILAGVDVHRELAELVKAGLTPAEALRTAIINPAAYLGRQSDYGSVSVGKVADLILLDANPLADIRHTQRIQTVIFGGNVYERRQLDELKEVVSKRARSWAVACRILWRFIRQPVSY
jgi:imidazolonepropionase-like amidohydrolase